MRSAVLLWLAVTVVLAGCASGSSSDPQAETTSRSSTPQTAGQLLSGGVDGFERRLASSQGRPVVVNQWASWCPPCKVELPYFSSQAKKLRGRVAFLGVNSRDTQAGAEGLLKRIEVPFPSYRDEDGKIARAFKGGRAWPTTAFYNAAGDLIYTHQGAYPNESELARDIRRYAIDG